MYLKAVAGINCSVNATLYYERCVFYLKVWGTLSFLYDGIYLLHIGTHPFLWNVHVIILVSTTSMNQKQLYAQGPIVPFHFTRWFIAVIRSFSPSTNCPSETSCRPVQVSSMSVSNLQRVRSSSGTSLTCSNFDVRDQFVSAARKLFFF